MVKASLSYHGGTIIINGMSNLPFAAFDPRINSHRAPAHYYMHLIKNIRENNIDYIDNVLDLVPSVHLGSDIKNHNYVNYHGDNNINKSSFCLRDYQQQAVGNWIRAKMRGCVVLPTGAGKTMVGMGVIDAVRSATLVIVPTIDLMEQWTHNLSKYYKCVNIGNLGGGHNNLQFITVATYDSAYLRASAIGNRFLLIIFDEVHHLAAPGYRTIAEQMASPYRLGLTATIVREDGRHLDLPNLVGETVFQISSDSLAYRQYLAHYEIETRQVQMLPDELREYKKSIDNYEECLRQLGFRYPIAFQKLILLSGRNKIAREAMLARKKADYIALNSKSKLQELKKIPQQNRGVKTIIFTQYNRLVYEISNTFLIPYITYKTAKEERVHVLDRFRNGTYRAIVTSKVLDEGLDVPDAELGVIVSGTGSRREFIQRLGRLLRPRLDRHKTAKLIEIISAKTTETHTSAKRLSALHEEEKDIKEDVHKSGSTLQVKALCFGASTDQAFTCKQISAVSNAVNSKYMLNETQQSDLCKKNNFERR